MCKDCGCSEIDAIAINGVIIPNTLSLTDYVHNNDYNLIIDPDHSHDPSHEHGNSFDLTPNQTPNHHHTYVIPIHQGILAKNDQIAQQNRKILRDRNVLCFNLLSSPGAGKTALIERMARDFFYKPNFLKMAVIVGDLATDNDAQRLRQAGVPAVQITTGNACHLEANMVAQAMQQLDWQGLNLLIIENVGNLVCPAAYDLGEAIRVVILSVTEGEDKPLKYPIMFKSADIVLVSKVDITEAVGCNLALEIANIARVAPQAKIFKVSARSGEGLEFWYDYLKSTMTNTIANTVQPEIALDEA
jgi:hydrogenase nickel incorporation protein HypB